MLEPISVVRLNLSVSLVDALQNMIGNPANVRIVVVTNVWQLKR